MSERLIQWHKTLPEKKLSPTKTSILFSPGVHDTMKMFYSADIIGLMESKWETSGEFFLVKVAQLAL